jgi:hypothetical protein
MKYLTTVTNVLLALVAVAVYAKLPNPTSEHTLVFLLAVLNSVVSLMTAWGIRLAQQQS